MPLKMLKFIVKDIVTLSKLDPKKKLIVNEGFFEN